MAFCIAKGCIRAFVMHMEVLQASLITMEGRAGKYHDTLYRQSWGNSLTGVGIA